MSFVKNHLTEVESSNARLGICPICGDDGRRKNVGSEHWGYCSRHGVKWSIYEDLRDSDRDLNSGASEEEDDCAVNDAFLMRFRGIRAEHRDPTVRERLRWRLRTWRRLFGKKLILEARINVIGRGNDACRACGCRNEHPPG